MTNKVMTHIFNSLLVAFLIFAAIIAGVIYKFPRETFSTSGPTGAQCVPGIDGDTGDQGVKGDKGATGPGFLGETK